VLKRLLIVCLLTMSIQVSAIFAEEKLQLTDIQGHWAEGAIEGAVTKGYVSGYGDETFRPNQPVTRAEFITMSVAAQGFATADQQTGEKWYERFIQSATQEGIHEESDFNTEWNKEMPRMEMVRIAARSADETLQNNPTSDETFMLYATQKGLITGMGNGELAPQGTTTRAQAVAVIERILTLKAGETLPVDEQAVQSAKAELEATAIPSNDIFTREGIEENLSTQYFDLVDGKLIFKDDGRYSGTEFTDYELSTAVNPFINEQVLNGTKAMVTEDKFTTSRYLASSENTRGRVLLGLSYNELFSQNVNYSFEYIFSETAPYDARDDWNQETFSEDVIVSLYIGKLSDNQHFPVMLVPEYEMKLKASIYAIFGQETGKGIYEFAMSEYKKRYTDEERIPRQSKVFGDWRMDFVIDGDLKFFFSYIGE
jgi:hypothetical protein